MERKKQMNPISQWWNPYDVLGREVSRIIFQFSGMASWVEGSTSDQDQKWSVDREWGNNG